MMHAVIHCIESNDYAEWREFAEYQSPDPYDDFGWFHVTVGATDIDGGNDFQVCVSTRRAVWRVKRSGKTPGILVDYFDAANVRKAICDRIEAIEGCSWETIVEQLRTFMKWEYEGMTGK
ncbi:MAG: hypothetical protein JNK57_14500 [Planctomycetaceae bacterium]|nr:hypothetical protein [Planctomycetaceae bacterium]